MKETWNYPLTGVLQCDILSISGEKIMPEDTKGVQPFDVQTWDHKVMSDMQLWSETQLI